MQSRMGPGGGSGGGGGGSHWSDGTVTAPGEHFGSDANSGVYRFAADGWGLTAGGVDVLRMVLDTYGTRASFGNPAVPITANGSGTILGVNHTTAANNNGTIGLAASLINNGALGALGTGFPDFAAVSLSTFQTDNAAMGSMRPIEAHSIRIKADPAASTIMIAEMGIHTVSAGNANFPFASIDAYSRGIWLSSYQDDNMTGYPGGPYVAQAVDVGLFITGHPGGGGVGGFRYPLACLNSSATLTFALSQTGTFYTATGGNAAAPTWTFIGDTNTGVFQGGADVLAFSAGSAEFARGTATGFQLSTGLVLDNVISPAQLVANTDNWQPAGIFSATVIRVSTDASRNLTGLQSLSKRVISLQNVGTTQNLVLKHDVTSTSTNRFLLPNNADLTLLPNQSVLLSYDDTSGRWRCLGGT